MKKTQFLQKILSSLTVITFVSLSGNMAFAGLNITYPGTGTDLDETNNLVPIGSISGNKVTVLSGEIQNVYGGYSKAEAEVVTENTVTISGGGITVVYGGHSDFGAATGNSVIILDGNIGASVHGGYSRYGAATGNTVTILGGFVRTGIYGGYSQTGEVTGNTVTVSAGQVKGDVTGGYSEAVSAGNTVIISGGATGEVFGGKSTQGLATSNTVTISGGTTEDVSGGFSTNGAATSNTVQILDGKITGKIYGGKSFSGEATNNSVTISRGTFSKEVYGGFSTKEAATGNTVTILGGDFSKEIYGGFSTDKAATGNTVTILGGDFPTAVYGGFSTNGAATGNTVTILGGDFSKEIYGGFSTDKAATGNTVTILGGDFPTAVYGGFSTNGAATGNTVTITVTISDGTINSVNGGFSTTGAATGNTVTISGGEIGGVYGGNSQLEATDNTVTISGGVFLGEVCGGLSNDGVATGNTVTISAGKIGGNVIGGKSYYGNTATNNTVILNSGASLSATSSIFGGYSANINANILTGNRLVLNDFQGTVKQISNFEFIDITSSGKEGDMLTLVGDEKTDLSQSKVNITFTGISRPFNMGDKIKLIKNEKGITMGSETLQQDGQQQVKGTVYIYDVLFDSDATSIHATFLTKKFNDRSKALAEGRVASMAHLNMGADLIAGQGMAQALDSDKLTGKIHLFSAMAATNSQYDTGSHVDLYGYSALVGASLAPAVLPSLNCGVFAESGWGHYGSFSDFEDGAVRGSGSTQYYGGGLLTHYDFTKMGIKGLTVEASFRAGKTDADYQSGDLTNSKYDLSTPYYGVHAGVNYTRELSEKLKIANYARFFWSHLDGDNTTIEGSDFRFRTMDSQRIKAGSRLFYEIAPNITPYAGLSYEWECSGTARAVVDGVNGMAAPSLRGGTGTGELGAVWKPMAHQAFWVDFSAQGHVGNRQGVSGVVRLRAEF